MIIIQHLHEPPNKFPQYEQELNIYLLVLNYEVIEAVEINWNWRCYQVYLNRQCQATR